MTRTRIFLAVSAIAASAALAQTPDHLVVGRNPPGGPGLKLFSADTLVGASGHGPSIGPGAIVPILRINLLSSYAQPRFGGYSFSTSGLVNLGLDYAAPPHDLDINLLPGPPPDFSVRLKRLAYDRPPEFSVYTPTGLPRMVEDGDEYAFGTASNGGHVHPLFLLRRPGVVRWDMQFTSDQWLASDAYTYYFTTVPGRGTLVPIDMSAAFNADLVDSDGGDTATSFDAGGHAWLLNGLYGTSAGLPTNGQVAGFQLGGPAAVRLLGSSTNALWDDGAATLAATVDLGATGQAGAYLSVELLVSGSGAFTTSDTISVTLRYSDATTKVVAIRQGTSDWLPYRPLDDWQQGATPRPWTAVGRSGDRALGFARSTGAGVDGAAGENTFLFRAGTPADSTRMLQQIEFADYTGAGRVAVFAVLAIAKAPLAITSAALPGAIEGQAYSFAVAAEGTPPFKNWGATGLPSGLTIDPDSGVISGTPAPGSAAGSPYSVQLSVEDSIDLFDASYPPESAMATLSLSVVPGVVAGDIDGDGDVDSADADLLVQVLIGELDQQPFVDRSDLDGNDVVDGRDVQPFVAALP